jgi:multicomponent Na+:H+ antiporter subunit E
VRNRIILFIFTLSTWSLLVWPPDAQHIMVGAVISLVVTYLTGDMFIKSLGPLFRPASYYYFFCVLAPLFFVEYLKASFKVASWVIRPSMPIEPGIIKVKTVLKTEMALTLMANIITLTSDTLTVDVNKDDGCFYVHSLSVKSGDSEKLITAGIKKFETLLQKIFE